MVSARDHGVWPGAAALVFSISFAIVALTLSAAPVAAQANDPTQPAASASAQVGASSGTQATAPAAPQMPGLAAVQTAPPKDQNPLGATVYSKDGRLAGAVDQVSGDQLVIGLAGYLGQGEKDIAISAKGLHVTTSDDVPRHAPNAQYGGGNITRVTVPMSLSEFVAAPAYKQPAAHTGMPSPHVGTPAEDKKKPPSSTASGGPG